MHDDQAVVNIKTDAYTRYIGRPSEWGNPFIVGRDGERGECVQLYKEWIVRGEGRHLLTRLGEIENQTLGCFCAPKGGATADDPDPPVCHGQILLQLLRHRHNKLIEKGLRQ